MIDLIESQDMFEFIDETFIMPKQYTTPSMTGVAAEKSVVVNPNFLVRKILDHLLCGWIIDTLSEEVLGLLGRLDTTAMVWKPLLDSFSCESQGLEFGLQQKFYMHRRRTWQFLNIFTFKGICDELAAIGKSINDRDKVLQFSLGSYQVMSRL